MREMASRPEHRDLLSSLNVVQKRKMNVFWEAASSFGKMSDVLKMIPHGEMAQLIDHLVVQAGGSLKESATLASMMVALKGDFQLRRQMEDAVVGKFKSASTQDVKDRYGILLSVYGRHMKPLNEEVSRVVAESSRYKPPSHDVVGTDLFINAGDHYQLAVFPCDEDGKESFAHFLDAYDDKKSWSTIDHGTYMVIESKNGYPVHIYANNPRRSEGLGSQAQLKRSLMDIQKAVAFEQGLEKGAHPLFQSFVERGHSFHDDEIRRFIGSGTKLVFVGACGEGGYDPVSKILAKAPHAQIISTTSTGTMKINDPLVYNLTDQIRRTGKISWSQLRGVLNGTGSKMAENYSLPNESISLEIQQMGMALKMRDKKTLQKYSEVRGRGARDFSQLGTGDSFAKKSSTASTNVDVNSLVTTARPVVPRVSV